MDQESKIRENDPFRVPEGYFESVREKITERIEDANKKPPARDKVLRILRPALMLAAAMTGLVIISYAGLRMLLPEKGADTGIEYAEISDYNLYGIDEATIINFLTEEETEELLPEQTEGDDNESEEIVNYLLDNNIDYSTLLEQF